MEYNIGQIPVNDTKWPCGIGYVSLPSNIDREQFISDCFLRGTISFKTRDGGHYHNCPIDKSKFNDLVWPTRWQENGSPIVYVTEPLHQQPIVIGVVCYNDEIVDQQENQFKLKRIYDQSIVEVTGSPENESLTFFVNGVQRADMYIRLTNAAQTAYAKIEVDGEYVLETLKKITIHSHLNVEQRVGETEEQSTKIVQTNSDVNMRVERFAVNDGSEPITLGNKMKKLMDDLIDELARTTVTTSLGQMPILNAAQVAAFKQRTQEILSEISFTD